MRKFQISIVQGLYSFFRKIESFAFRRRRSLERLRFFLGFKNRDEDIYISTFLKSGTTWTQMIVYLLLNDKEPDFDHIYDVSPWLSNEAFLGKTADRVNNLPSPRFFKSHDRYLDFDEEMKSKIIYVYRNVEDLAVSLLHHQRAYKSPEIELDTIIENHFDTKKDNNWFKYHSDWLKNQKKLTIHYIRYEELKSNFEETVTKLANYLEVKMTPEKMEFVKKYSTFEYMKMHEPKFGEQPSERDFRKFDQFIRKGQVGEGKKQLSTEQSEKLHQDYRFLVKPLEQKIEKV